MSWIKINIGQYFVSFLILFAGLFHIGLPLYADVILSLMLAFILQSWVASVVTSATLFFGIIIINLIFEGEIDYRAHERLSTNNARYEADVAIEFIQPYGDLFAIGGKSKELASIIERRDIEFVTDSEGHRNRKFYNDPAYILVGDSFIVGNGTTQSDILSERMSTLLGSNVYSLSYPGNPAAYEAKLKEYENVLSGGKNVLLFYFEGNDFLVDYPTTVGTTTVGTNKNDLTFKAFKKTVAYLDDLKSMYLKKVYPKWFKFSKVVNRKSKLSYTVIKNFVTDTDVVSQVKIIVKEIAGQEVGSLKRYNDVSTAENVDTYIWSEPKLIERIKYVFFIPTKYRAYHNLDANLPLQILKERYNQLNIPVFDLTSILKNEAKRKLEANEFLYWRDDTHCNGVGLSTAGDYIATLLLSSTDKVPAVLE